MFVSPPPRPKATSTGYSVILARNECDAIEFACQLARKSPTWKGYISRLDRALPVFIKRAGYV